MSTADFVLNDQSGAAFRAELNAILAAILSTNSSTTVGEPTGTGVSAYMLRVNTTTGHLNIRNSANNAWVELPFRIDAKILKSDTIEEDTAGSGVTIDGLKVKDAGLVLGSDADGDIYYRSGGALVRLAKGTANYPLKMNSGATAPEWAQIIAACLAADSVTTDKILAKNVTLAKIADFSGVSKILGAGTAAAAATELTIGSNLTLSGTTLSADSQAPGTNSITQAMLNDSIVGQAELKTTQGAVSVSNTSSSNLTLPGGSYGFYPQLTRTVGDDSYSAQIVAGFWGSYGVYATYIRLYSSWSGGTPTTAYAQQRYVTASFPYNLGDGDIPLFVFALVDNATGNVVSMYTAPEAPWHYNGPTDIIGKLGPDGKKYKLAKITKKHPSNFELDEIAYERIEITQAIKNADIGLIPHPFCDNRTGKTIVLLDPVADMAWKMRDSFEDNLSELHDLFYKNKLKIDSTPLNRKGPKGVLCCAAKWKNSGK